MAMSMVASGKADAYYESGPHIWDFAAGDLLVRESGGTVVDTAGTVKDSSNSKHFSHSLITWMKI